MAEHIQKSLFEPFVSDGKQSGTGLGLTLANAIAKEHGGAVRLFESMPGGRDDLSAFVVYRLYRVSHKYNTGTAGDLVPYTRRDTTVNLPGYRLLIPMLFW